MVERESLTRAERVRPWALAALLALLVGAAFSPSFSAQFVNWDDHVNLADLRRRASAWSFFVEPGSVDPYQPLAWLTLRLDQWLWGLDAGLDAPQAGRFHATSAAFHALAAIAFLFAARKLLSIAAPNATRASSDFASAFAALVFAVHPLRAESVAWITERRDVVSGLLYLLALLAWLSSAPSASDRVQHRGAGVAAVVLAVIAALLGSTSLDFEGRTLDLAGAGALGLAGALAALLASTWFATRALSLNSARALRLALCVLAFALALTAKGLTIVLPAMLLAIDLWPLRRLRGSSLAAAALEKAPLFALAAVSARLSLWAQVANGRTLADSSTHALSERVLQACYGLWFYPSRTLVPLPTSPSNFLPDELSFTDARFAVAASVVAVSAATLLALRKRWPGVALAFAAFAVGAAPILGLTQAGAQLVADRYSYIACMPLALLAGAAWRVGLERQRALAFCAALVVAGGLTWATRTQTSAWRDSESLWRHAVERDPRDGFALAQLGSALVADTRGAQSPEQVAQLRREADELFRRALEVDPTPLPGSLLYHGINLLALKRLDESIAVLRGHLTDFPDDTTALTYLGSALGAQGRFDDARAALERAVLDPDAQARAWESLGRVREELDDRAGAITAYEQLLTRWPDHSGARQRLAALSAR